MKHSQDRDCYVRFPDFLNQLESYDGNGTHTLQHDGWLLIRASSAWTMAEGKINGVTVFTTQITDTKSYHATSCALVPVKKNDVVELVVSAAENSTISCLLYGFR